MAEIYHYIQILHLYCAIFFVGYLFFDVVIFRTAKKKMPPETQETAAQAIKSSSIKFMPLFVFIIFLTGMAMMPTWVNSQIGYFTTNMQKAFMVKVILGFIIFALVGINLTYKFILKRKSPLGNIHPVALVASVVIVFLAIKFQYIA